MSCVNLFKNIPYVYVVIISWMFYVLSGLSEAIGHVR